MAISAQARNGSESRDELWTLYKLALDDRNFQVNLNWDRTKHYFIFNFAAFSVAGGLSRLPGSYWVVYYGLFVLVLLNSLFAAYSIWKGHQYYRASRKHLKVVERQLGLIGENPADSPLALNTTRGMARDTIGQGKRTPWEYLTIINFSIVLQLYIGAAAVVALTLLLR